MMFREDSARDVAPAGWMDWIVFALMKALKHAIRLFQETFKVGLKGAEGLIIVVCIMVVSFFFYDMGLFGTHFISGHLLGGPPPVNLANMTTWMEYHLRSTHDNGGAYEEVAPSPPSQRASALRPPSAPPPA